MQTAIMLNPAPTKQELFDAIVLHAMAMPTKSTVTNKTQLCAYRGKDDNACFVGCLVTDEEAVPMDQETIKLRGGSVDDLNLKGILPDRLVPHVDLLERVQPIHDEREQYEWLEQLEAAGRDMDLSTNVIDQCRSQDAVSARAEL